MARWLRFMLITFIHRFNEKDVLDLSMLSTLRFRTEDGHAGDRQQGQPALLPRPQQTGGVIMFSRRAFLQRAVGVGGGGLVLANHHSFAREDPPVSHPSSPVIFETVRTNGLAHLSYLISDRSSGHAAVIAPRRDVDVYLELARQHHLTITHPVETHIHAYSVSATPPF